LGVARRGVDLIQDGERGIFAMPIALRADFTAEHCRSLARKTKDAGQARRLLALASIYEGATRTEAAKIGGVTLQIVRDWVMKFNAEGAEGLIDRKPPGQPARLSDRLREEFSVSIAKQTLSRELRAMGYRKLSARPRHHAQAEGAIEDFKKNSRPSWVRSRASKVSTRTI
jgi:transposase